MARPSAQPTADTLLPYSLATTDAVDAIQPPAVCTTSTAIRAATAATRAGRRQRVATARATPRNSSAPSPSQGHGDEPGTHSMSPATTTVRPSMRSGTRQAGTTTCARPGAACTAAGAGPTQWARWSCHLAVVPPAIRCHRGGPTGSPAAGTGAFWPPRRLARLVGEPTFSSAPPGPTRR